MADRSAEHDDHAAEPTVGPPDGQAGRRLAVASLGQIRPSGAVAAGWKPGSAGEAHS
jgi:hypothetical protein